MICHLCLGKKGTYIPCCIQKIQNLGILLKNTEYNVMAQWVKREYA